MVVDRNRQRGGDRPGAAAALARYRVHGVGRGDELVWVEVRPPLGALTALALDYRQGGEDRSFLGTTIETSRNGKLAELREYASPPTSTPGEVSGNNRAGPPPGRSASGSGDVIAGWS